MPKRVLTMLGPGVALLVGGCPKLPIARGPRDTDRDGMPDAYETEQGLDPTDPADGNHVLPSGYTQLENYLNSLIEYARPANSAHVPFAAYD